MKPDLESIRIGLANLAASSAEISPEHVPALMAELARAQAALLVALNRLVAANQRDTRDPEPDRMLDVNEAAALTGLTPRWLYRHAKTLPFTRKLSRKVVRFSRAGIARWLETKHFEQSRPPR